MTNREKAIGLCALAAALLIQLHTISTHVRLGGDFDQEYQSASALLQGQSLYSGWNDHPPLSSFVGLPFVTMSLETASLAFGFVTVIGYSLVVAFVLIESFGMRLTSFAIVSAFLVAPSSIASSSLGALSFLVSTLVILAWHCGRRGSGSAVSALALALASLIKVYPVGALVAAVASRRRLGSWTVCIAAALTILSLSVIEPADYLRFVAKHEGIREKFRDYPSNFSVSGNIHRLLGAEDGWVSPLIPALPVATALSWLAAAILIGGLVSCLVVERRAKLDLFDDHWHLGLITMVLLGPISWGHYLTFLAPLLALQLYRGELDYRSNRGFVLVVGWLLLFAPQIWLMRAIGTSWEKQIPWYQSWDHTLQTVGAVLLWGALVAKAARANAESQAVDLSARQLPGA